MSDNIKVLLVGCGSMGIEYTKILKRLGVEYIVVGNSKKGTENYRKETNVEAYEGGIELFLNKNKDKFSHAIVAVPMTKLCESTVLLIKNGVKKILVEKPAGMDIEEVKKIVQMAKWFGVNVYVGYNRRFYSSVKEAEHIIEKDGGVTSYSFEFTEWADTVESSNNSPEVLNRWLLGNSTHVIDLAFFLGGIPEQMSSYVNGELKWHHGGAVYSGAGRANNGALFSYNANWDAPGRWSVEILTREHRLYYRPIEKLQVQERNSVKIVEVTIDNTLDVDFKPGLYRQTEAFLYHEEDRHLISIDEHFRIMSLYEQIAGIEKNLSTSNLNN